MLARDKLEAKDGDWVGIEYKNNGKIEKTSAQIKEVECQNDWKHKLIIIDTPVQEKLKIPDEIVSKDPTDPSKYEVDVKKHFFPRDLKFWGAILTAIITIFAAGFSAYSEMLPDGDPLKFAFGFVALMVLFTGAILACISTILQKQ